MKIIISKVGDGMKKLIAIFLLICSWNVGAMYLPQSMKGNRQLQKFTENRMTQIKQQMVKHQQQQRIKLEQEKEVAEDPNVILVRSMNESEGVIVKKEDVIKYSETAKGMLEDWGDSKEKVIPLPFPVDRETIKLSFDICSNTAEPTVGSLKQAVDVANVMHFMHVSDDNQKKIMDIIKYDIQKDNNVVFDSVLDVLDSDLKKLLIKVLCIEKLNDLVREKLSHWITTTHDSTFLLVFHPQGTMVAYGCGKDKGNSGFELAGGDVFWDSESYKNIKGIDSIAFSSDGKYVVAAGRSSWMGHNLFIFDCLTKHRNRSYSLDGWISAVKFIPQTTKLICVNMRNFVEIFDVTQVGLDPLYRLPSHMHVQINCVDCSNTIDRKFIVTGGAVPPNVKKSEALTIWDMRKFDYNNPQEKDLQKKVFNGVQIESVFSLATNHNSSKIAVGCFTLDGNNMLLLIDVTDLDDMKYQVLKTYDCRVNSVAFDVTGNFILVGLNKVSDNVELFDIRDLKNIISNKFTGISNIVYAVAFDPRDSNCISIGGQYSSLVHPCSISWTLCTEKQHQVIDYVKNKCNGDQLLFIYRLIEKITKNKSIILHQENIMQLLNNDVKELLKDLGLINVQQINIEELSQSIPSDGETQQPQQNEHWLWKWAREKKDQLRKLAREYIQYAS
jgi:WD40 repeat protein